MKKLLFIIGCIVAFGLSVFVGTQVGTAYVENQAYGYLKVDFKGKVVKDLTYGDKSLNNYDLYLPADNTKEAYSFILYIHGGGFTAGDKGITEAKRYGEYLAHNGYVVASVNYSLSSESTPVSVRVMYDEIMSSVPVIVNKLEELGYHLNEMATTGCSAGGCLAMLVALKEPEQLPIPVKFIFEQTGPASFDPDVWVGQDAANDDKANFVNSVTGRSFTASDVGSDEFKAAWMDISPMAYVNENTIPILLAYGPNDKVVPPDVKKPFLKALDDCNVTHKYIEFPNSGHGLLGDPDKLKEYYAAMEEYLSMYFGN